VRKCWPRRFRGRDGGEPSSEPFDTTHLVSTILHTVFDVGRLRLLPAFATIARLGETPLQLDLPRSQEAIELTLTKVGFAPLPFKVIPNQDKDVVAQLNALAAPPPPAPTAAAIPRKAETPFKAATKFSTAGVAPRPSVAPAPPRPPAAAPAPRPVASTAAPAAIPRGPTTPAASAPVRTNAPAASSGPRPLKPGAVR